MGDLSSGEPDLDDLKSCLIDLEELVQAFSVLISQMETVDQVSQPSRASQKFRQLVIELRHNCDRFQADIQDYRNILSADDSTWTVAELEDAYSNLTDQLIKVRRYVLLAEKVFLRFLKEEI